MVLDEGSLDDFPIGIYEDAEELGEGVDYVLERVEINNERALYNYGLNEIKAEDGSGGVTIESLMDQALKIKSREQRLDRHSVYGRVLEEDVREKSLEIFKQWS